MYFCTFQIKVEMKSSLNDTFNFEAQFEMQKERKTRGQTLLGHP